MIKASLPQNLSAGTECPSGISALTAGTRALLSGTAIAPLIEIDAQTRPLSSREKAEQFGCDLTVIACEDGHIDVISPTSGNRYSIDAETGCSCPAGKAGRSCWHLLTLEMEYGCIEKAFAVLLNAPEAAHSSRPVKGIAPIAIQQPARKTPPAYNSPEWHAQVRKDFA